MDLPVITEATAEFYRNVYADPELGPMFKGVNMLTLRTHVSYLIYQMTTFDAPLTERELEHQRQVHKHIIIKHKVTKHHFDIWIRHLMEAMRTAVAEEEQLEKLRIKLLPLRDMFLPDNWQISMAGDPSLLDSAQSTACSNIHSRISSEANTVYQQSTTGSYDSHSRRSSRSSNSRRSSIESNSRRSSSRRSSEGVYSFQMDTPRSAACRRRSTRDAWHGLTMQQQLQETLSRAGSSMSSRERRSGDLQSKLHPAAVTLAAGSPGSGDWPPEQQQPRTPAAADSNFSSRVENSDDYAKKRAVQSKQQQQLATRSPHCRGSSTDDYCSSADGLVMQFDQQQSKSSGSGPGSKHTNADSAGAKQSSQQQQRQEQQDSKSTSWLRKLASCVVCGSSVAQGNARSA